MQGNIYDIYYTMGMIRCDQTMCTENHRRFLHQKTKILNNLKDVLKTIENDEQNEKWKFEENYKSLTK